ncbi:winged helix-turn-helix domain-containing protein [Sphaerisporangium sp. NBC_01403]|uniref:winged helix-turn-helix domain-containing protein n=1 Tax=Sphaerisporangium sp. NBC_01403 TaxID=2903599 RepID=UPI00324A2B46
MTGTLGDEEQLLALGIAQLAALLGSDWEISLEPEPSSPRPQGLSPGRPDRLIGVTDSAHTFYGQVLAEAVLDPTPARLERELLPRISVMRRFSPGASAVVIAPWLSPRTRELLSRWDCGYLDLTGNVSFTMRRPAVVIRTDGAARDPRGRRGSGGRGLRGLRAGRLVRALADVRPPYRAAELAQAVALSPPYVSRLLDVMEEEGLIRRRDKVVTKVDWESLLRARASATSLLKTGDFRSLLAPNGLDSFLEWLSGQEQLRPSVAVTGPVAAAAVAPLAIGGQAVLYTRGDVQNDLIAEQGLLAVDQGADVLLIEARDPVMFTGLRLIQGLPHVALSQLALDCLSGSGRMPAAGEAVLDHMRDHEKQWRMESLDQLRCDAP